MDVTIIGTGNMARAIGRRAIDGGHRVTVVGKDEEHARQAAGELGEVDTAVFGEGPVDGDVVVLAVYYPDAREAVQRLRDELAGKVVVDITNPVNEAADALVVPPDSSAAQELAGIAPDAKFVKAFNTTFANTLAGGEVAGQALDVCMAGGAGGGAGKAGNPPPRR